MTSITPLGLHSRATRLRGELPWVDATFDVGTGTGLSPSPAPTFQPTSDPARPQENVLRLQFAEAPIGTPEIQCLGCVRFARRY